MQTLWIFSIEPLESRYTKQWHEHLPVLLRQKYSNINVVQLDGIQLQSEVTQGAFLNFSDTNYWKSSQLCKFLEQYNHSRTSPDDHFLFTDAWNPVVLQLRYMSDLLGQNWKMHGLWHAGAYDKHDFLGRNVGLTPWIVHTEQAMFNAFDHNYFATDFHIRLFADTYSRGSYNNRDEWIEQQLLNKKIIRTGWPMEYLTSTVSKGPKRNLIVFPHRIAPEKQVEIFRDLAVQLPQYEFVVCQDQKLTKDEYHKLLSEAKVLFSANLQETLGITTCAEGPIAGAIPYAPDRLSYTEIFKDYPEFLYPSSWTESFDMYVQARKSIVSQIVEFVENYENYAARVEEYSTTEMLNYFSFKGVVGLNDTVY